MSDIDERIKKLKEEVELLEKIKKLREDLDTKDCPVFPDYQPPPFNPNPYPWRPTYPPYYFHDVWC